MTLSRKRFYSIGAQGGGTLYRRFYNRINTENFIDFLVHLYEEYGMFVIFLDNAPCHKSRALQEFPGGMNGEIRIYHFPSYTPEPDPAEEQWMSFRKATGNRLHKSVREMQGFH